VDFHDLKGIVEGLCMEMGLAYGFRPCSDSEPWLVPGASLELLLNDKTCVGVFGLVSDDVCRAFDIDAEVYAFDFSLDMLSSYATEERSFVPLNRFPAIELDIAIIVDDSVRAQDIVHFVRENSPDFLESCRIFDVYRGKPVPGGSKSLGLRFTYRDPDRTLAEDDIISGHNGLVDSIMKRFRAVFRA
jgi:phenylalanyl-tRNA synthetase beta chain